MTIRRRVHGVGYKGVGRHVVSVKTVRTHTYMTWYNMMTRCYSKKLHERCPQYAICEVDEIWHNFQNFADWYESNKFSKMGYHLDKDLIVSGNNIYSPKNCCLIPQELNKSIITRQKKGGSLMGTHWHKRAGKWVASVSNKGKQVYLGSFNTELEAYAAYVKAKTALVREQAIYWSEKIEPRAFSALMRWTPPHPI